jgi:hypothetical protein
MGQARRALQDGAGLTAIYYLCVVILVPSGPARARNRAARGNVRGDNATCRRTRFLFGMDGDRLP